MNIIKKQKFEISYNIIKNQIGGAKVEISDPNIDRYQRRIIFTMSNKIQLMMDYNYPNLVDIMFIDSENSDILLGTNYLTISYLLLLNNLNNYAKFINFNDLKKSRTVTQVYTLSNLSRLDNNQQNSLIRTLYINTENIKSSITNFIESIKRTLPPIDKNFEDRHFRGKNEQHITFAFKKILFEYIKQSYVSYETTVTDDYVDVKSTFDDIKKFDVLKSTIKFYNISSIDKVSQNSETLQSDCIIDLLMDFNEKTNFDKKLIKDFIVYVRIFKLPNNA